MQTIDETVGLLMRLIKVVIVDDKHVMRKVIRALLMSIGVEKIFEAGDGISGLDTVRTVVPQLVLLDWDMPGMSGREFVKKVRSPETFPLPNVPIVILTGHCEKSCVVDAERLGVNEYLVKPVSGEQLLSCILSVVAKPRPFVRIGDYYGPESREAALG